MRSIYSGEHLPDWVGKFKDKVDYAAILLSEGIELPAMEDDASVDEVDVTEEELDTGDVQDGTPAQANATVANDFEPSTPMSTHEQSSTPTHSHPQQSHEQSHCRAMNKALQSHRQMQMQSHRQRHGRRRPYYGVAQSCLIRLST